MYSTEEIIKELEREIKMRKEVFEKWVLQGRMKEHVKERRIGILEQILDDYRQKQKIEENKNSLFA